MFTYRIKDGTHANKYENEIFTLQGNVFTYTHHLFTDEKKTRKYNQRPHKKKTSPIYCRLPVNS